MAVLWIWNVLSFMCPDLDRSLEVALLDCSALLGGAHGAVRPLRRGETCACCDNFMDCFEVYLWLCFVYLQCLVLNWSTQGRFIFSGRISKEASLLHQTCFLKDFFFCLLIVSRTFGTASFLSSIEDFFLWNSNPVLERSPEKELH